MGRERPQRGEDEGGAPLGRARGGESTARHRDPQRGRGPQKGAGEAPKRAQARPEHCLERAATKQQDGLASAREGLARVLVLVTEQGPLR